MGEDKWVEHAQLVLKSIEAAEKNCEIHREKISSLENQVGNLWTILKIAGPIVGALVVDAIRSYVGG